MYVCAHAQAQMWKEESEHACWDQAALGSDFSFDSLTVCCWLWYLSRSSSGKPRKRP